jgi:hypothetical protein
MARNARLMDGSFGHQRPDGLAHDRIHDARSGRVECLKPEFVAVARDGRRHSAPANVSRDGSTTIEQSARFASPTSGAGSAAGSIDGCPQAGVWPQNAAARSSSGKRCIVASFFRGRALGEVGRRVYLQRVTSKDATPGQQPSERSHRHDYCGRGRLHAGKVLDRVPIARAAPDAANLATARRNDALPIQWAMLIRCSDTHMAGRACSNSPSRSSASYLARPT